VGSGGAGVISPVTLHLGTIVTFKCGVQRVYAKVVNCRPSATGYRLALKINDAVEE